MMVALGQNQEIVNMKKIKHIVFWLIVLGLILLLFSSHVIAEDVFQRQRHEWVNIIKDDVALTSAVVLTIIPVVGSYHVFRAVNGG